MDGHAPINLRLDASEVNVLTGASGSGKTSLALALVGLLDYRGSIRIDGVELRELQPHELRRQVVLVEQRPRAFIGTVFDNLAISGSESEAAQREALELVGLWSEIVDRGGLGLELIESGANLSGGQLQRLAIARALLTDCQLIILDEPTSGLDFHNAELLVGVIHSLKAMGIGTLVISHDEEFCTRLDAATRTKLPAAVANLLS